MPRRTIQVDGEQWTVVISGRVTQYLKDEFALVFNSAGAPGTRPKQRVARYSPLGAKSREHSLSQLTDADLRNLLAHSQPAWTAPETGYRR